MLMDAYGREGGVKNPKNHAYVIYGCLQTVNFAFIIIFDSLAKIAVFRASLLFLGDSRHAFLPGSRI